MKFFATIPVVALFAVESLAIAIPSSDSEGALALDSRDLQNGGRRLLEARRGRKRPQGAAPAAGQAGAANAGAKAQAPAAAAPAAANPAAAAGKAGGRKGGRKGGKKAAATAATGAAAGTAAGAAAAAPPPAAAAAAAGGQGAAALQTSLTLDPRQIQSNLAKNGQEAGAEAGQVPSITSTNNFINFCATQQTSLTNGLQTKTGSCNPTPMGRIIATDKLVSSKFTNPLNSATIPAKTTFTISMAIKNMVTGNFVNPQTNYYAAPCQVDGTGTVIGHSHVVVEQMSSLTQNTVTDPNVFAFFKGLNGVAANGQLTAEVTGGLAPGVYRLGSINACANHQPVLGAVAQHGLFDDVVYFEVK